MKTKPLKKSKASTKSKIAPPKKGSGPGVLNFLVPAGTIIMWYPPPGVTTIPAGWAICDGQLGRPDLINRFPLGAPKIQDSGKKGGAPRHDHEVSIITGSGSPQAKLQFQVTSGDARSNPDGWAWEETATRQRAPQATGLDHSHIVRVDQTLPNYNVQVGGNNQRTVASDYVPLHTMVLFLIKLK